VVRCRPTAFDAHRARIEGTLTALGWPVPDLTGAPELIAYLARDLEEARARLTVVRCSPAVFGWALQVGPVSPALPARRRGVRARTRPSPVEAGNPEWKTVDRARALARLAAAVDDAEVLLADDSGHLLEGSTWNLFAVVAGVLVTPPLDGRCLPGVTRGRVLAAAARLGFAHVEAPLTRQELLRRAAETFVTNALLPLAPLCSLDDQPLPGAGAMATCLHEAIDAPPP
jgi:branched-subunit amino acid aminotransferase/4-amino-4-deoxychorismate lyase